MPPVAADRQGGQDKSPNPRSCRMRAFARYLAALSVVAATLVATDFADQLAAELQQRNAVVLPAARALRRRLRLLPAVGQQLRQGRQRRSARLPRLEQSQPDRALHGGK